MAANTKENKAPSKLPVAKTDKSKTEPKKAVTEKAAKPAPAEKTVKAQKVASPAKPVKETKAKTVVSEDTVEVANVKASKGVVGKYKIEKAYGSLYMFYLYANNGQLLYESKEYASKKSCLDGIETFKKHIADETTSLRVDMDKNKRYKYIFKNRNSIYVGETYTTKSQAESSAESVKKFALVSSISE